MELTEKMLARVTTGFVYQLKSALYLHPSFRNKDGKWKKQ